MMNLCTIGARHPLRAAAVIVISGGLLCACSGADGAKAVADALSTLETAHYTVGGTVSALSGTGLVVEDNGGDDRAIASNGSFTFATSLAAGASYSVTVKTQPTDPPQACTVSNGSGTVGSSNITNVVVDCSLTAVATAVGTPVGQPSSQTIDAAGGSIVSPDNRLTVTVPPNAVATATTLTIQPITNQAPGGLGSAYRLGPEGQTFDTPVQISFHYTSQDLAGTVTDALEIAYQNTQDYWQAYKSATLDTAQQTLTVTSSHFSDWSMLAGSQIQPPAASVQVGNTVALTLVFCEKVATLDGTPDGLLTSLMAKCASGIDLASDWEVNSIAGGNASVGTVVADSGSEDSATYTAPAAVPQANPVAVSTQSAVFVPGTEMYVSNITVLPNCSAQGASCSWSGTVQAVFQAYTVSGQVTWELSPTQPTSAAGQQLVAFVPTSGSLTFTLHKPGCAVDSNSATTWAVTSGNSAANSALVVDYGQNPPTYGGQGLTSVQIGIVCNDSTTDTYHALLWFEAIQDTSSTNGDTLQGTYGGLETTGTTWTWDFTSGE